MFGIVGSNADESDVSARTTPTQIHKQAIRILLFKIVSLSPFVSERDYNSFPVSFTDDMIVQAYPPLCDGNIGL